MRATYVGSRREVVTMEVSNTIQTYQSLVLTNIAGRHRNQDAIVKEESKSPSRPGPKKRKAYSTVSANSIGTLEQIDEQPAMSSQPLRKRPKRAKSPTLKVDMVIPRMTRKSARNEKASSKRDLGELYRRIGQEHAALAKSYDDLADNMD